VKTNRSWGRRGKENFVPLRTLYMPLELSELRTEEAAQGRGNR